MKASGPTNAAERKAWKRIMQSNSRSRWYAERPLGICTGCGVNVPAPGVQCGNCEPSS